jgi:hypothetical protein
MVERDEILSAAGRVLRDDPHAAVPLFEQLPGGTQVVMLTSLFAARPTWFVRAVLAAIADLIAEHPDEAVAMFSDPMTDGLDDDLDAVIDQVDEVDGQIESFFHCAQCEDERPDGQSPRDWARLEIGLTASRRLQVWCIRHARAVGMFVLAPQRIRVEAGCGHVAS